MQGALARFDSRFAPLNGPSCDGYVACILLRPIISSASLHFQRHVNRASYSRFSVVLPWLIGIAWLCFLGWRIWLYAELTIQPPVFDAFSYYDKAHGIWDDITKGPWTNPLDVEPSIRPPATVLVSYPFGFQLDFHAFYFRTVFLPIVLIFASVLIVLKRSNEGVGDGVREVFVAAFLATPSLLFHFDFANDQPLTVSYWGLVDGFLTGVAALTAGCAVRGVRDRSLGYTFTAVALGAIMIFVKPVGVLLAALVDLALVAGWGIGVARSLRSPKARSQAFIRIATLILAVLFFSGGAVLLARHSRYLGPENMAAGIASLDILRAEYAIQLSELFPLLQSGVGPFILVWLLASVLVLALNSLYGKSARETPEPGVTFELGVALLVMLIGIWFWIFGSGGFTQIRYFLPFLFTSLIWALTSLRNTLVKAPGVVNWIFAVLMSAGILNVALLFAVPNPSQAWQRLSGVDLTAGSYPPGLDQAKLVVASTPASAKRVQVYSLNQGVNDAMFESILDAQSFESATPQFHVQRPIDWLRPSTFRIEEIIGSDYIVFNPSYCSRPELAAATNEVATFNDEEVAFCRWGSGLKLEDGIEELSSEPESRLLKVVNQDSLRRSIRTFAQAHRWRSVFIDENPPPWWSEAQIVAALAPSATVVRTVRFGQEFELGAVELERIRPDKLTLNVWLKATSDPVRDDWKLIVHVLNDKGTLIANHDAPLGVWPAGPQELPYRYIRLTFIVPKEATGIAFGIYRDRSLLLADRGTRDWGGGRLILALPEFRGPK